MALDPEAGLIARGFGAQGSLLGMEPRANTGVSTVPTGGGRGGGGGLGIPGGFLTVPRLLDPAGAPLLDESALLWLLTIQPDKEPR